MNWEFNQIPQTKKKKKKSWGPCQTWLSLSHNRNPKGLSPSKQSKVAERKLENPRKKEGMW